MNLSKIIDKFKKLGFSALSADEVSLLNDNIGLLPKAIQTKFADDQEAAAEGTEEGTKEEEKKEETEDNNVDEKALSDLIAKNVETQLAKKVDSITDNLVSKFLAGTKKNRTNVIDTGDTKKVDANVETKSFMKALVTRDHQTLNTMQKDGMGVVNTADSGSGGYLVPPQLMAEILRILPTGYGIARKDFGYLPFSGPGNERKIPTLASSVSTSWVGEGETKGKTAPSFGVVTQTLKKLAAIIPFTEEILEDSAINLTQLVAQLFAEAVAKEEDLQFFAGTGSPWTGILHNGDVNQVSFSADPTTSALADALLDMQDATPAGALTGAKYYMHRSVLSLVRKIKSTTTGTYIYSEPQGTAPATLWNYPIELCEAFPAISDLGGEFSGGFIAFGNLKVAAILGDKQQIRAKVLDQATISSGMEQINLAEKDMVALRLEERVGYVLAVPKAVTILVPTRGS